MSDTFSLNISNRLSLLECQVECTQATSGSPRQDHLLKVQGNTLGDYVKRIKRKILLLKSSHGRGMGDLLKTSLGNEYSVSSIFKPNS